MMVICTAGCAVAICSVGCARGNMFCWVCPWQYVLLGVPVAICSVVCAVAICSVGCARGNMFCWVCPWQYVLLCVLWQYVLLCVLWQYVGISGPTLWNALPQYLRDISDIAKFKRQLKTHLFAQHYGQ